MNDLCVIKPKQIKPIPWGWTNIDGWVVKPRGEVVMPHLIDYFDWASSWEISSIKELPVNNVMIGNTSMFSVFTTACRFLGMDKALIQLYDGTLEEDLCIIASEMYQWNEYLLKYWPLSFKPMIAIQGDEIGSSKGMMISPDLYRKYLKNLHSTFVDLYQYYDIPIWYHADGDISEVIDDIAEIGYTGIYYEDIGDMYKNMEKSSLNMIEVVR